MHSFQQTNKQIRKQKLTQGNNAKTLAKTETQKLSKQLDYANRRQLNLALICGENEFKENKITLKNLKGEKGNNQITVSKENLINEIKKLI